MTITILTGCALSLLETLPDQSVHTCVTSPPYFGLRDYGVEGQIGLEPTPEEFVTALVRVFREVRRVLRDDGTLWLNLGDSYADATRTSARRKKDAGGVVRPGGTKQCARCGAQFTGGTGRRFCSPRCGGSDNTKRSQRPDGLKHKDLLGIPWRVALALRADGWYLRSDIIWSKPNPMPESVTDRPTKSHEYLFLLSKCERYFYDHEAVKEPMAAASVERLYQDVDGQTGSVRANGGGKTTCPMRAVGKLPKGNAKTFRGGGAYTQGQSFDNGGSVERDSHGNVPNGTGVRNRRSVWEVATTGFSEAHFATFPPKLIEPCILAGSPHGGTVLDPFFGAGTTGLVADRHERHCIGIELNPEYVRIAERRLRKDAGMFADVTVVA